MKDDNEIHSERLRRIWPMNGRGNRRISRTIGPIPTFKINALYGKTGISSYLNSCALPAETATPHVIEKQIIYIYIYIYYFAL
jgi:hypothetical protein